MSTTPPTPPAPTPARDPTDVRVRRVRTRDGREQVLVDVVDFEALVIAAEAATAPPLSAALMHEIIERLRQNFEADEPYMDLDEFLAAYDAAHPAD
jgi:hypothetical protein